MKKTVALITVLLICVSLLVSCGDRDYDENEVISVAKTLIEGSVMLNEVYYGDGIPHGDDKNTSDGDFYEAQYFYLVNNGFKTVDELKALTEKIFTKGYSEHIFKNVLNRIQDGDKAIILERYYQKYSVADGTTPEAIMVNSKWKKIFTDKLEYHFETLTAVGSEGETVYVTLDCTVTRSGFEPQRRSLKIALIEQEDGWRIDSPTYMNYDTTKIN